MIRLFTDTSANLPLELIRQYNISIVPFSYTVDDKEALYDENTDFDGKAFYSAMRNGAAVKTSMINTDAFLGSFEPAAAAGDDVLYVGMSGGISGAANSAALAVRELKEKYPGCKPCRDRYLCRVAGRGPYGAESRRAYRGRPVLFGNRAVYFTE